MKMKKMKAVKNMNKIKTKYRLKWSKRVIASLLFMFLSQLQYYSQVGLATETICGKCKLGRHPIKCLAKIDFNDNYD